MKKLFILLNDDRGFIFPWFLIASLIMIMITVSISHQYKNEIISTASNTSQAQLQNLLNYGQTMMKETSEFTDPVLYKLPSGSVIITCHPFSEEMDECLMEAELNNGKNMSIKKQYPAGMVRNTVLNSMKFVR
ncbi:hypothetical protein [Halobacillus massiliensis]|uniref:hypothetical protein n=1 Tax=Halobacillus massiliensis TaxID=1926286 RepID=UPI0009E65D72|nr:hypothetical protein [Halobacillus massiliensis]